MLGRAQEELGGNGRRSILFLDEIHRFNKAQQDALLPAVETGLIVLIGATTENPYFDVNAALLSRCEVYELEALAPEELFRLIERGAQELCVELDTHVAEAIVERAGGDARTALSTLELATATARHEQAEQPLETAHPNVTVAHVEDAAHKRPLLYDRAGDRHYNFTSALIKSIRGSDPDAAVYYLATMIEAGEDPRFIARRLVVHRERRHRQRRPDGAHRRRRGSERRRARWSTRSAAQPGPRDALSRYRRQVERGRGGTRAGYARRSLTGSATTSNRAS